MDDFFWLIYIEPINYGHDVTKNNVAPFNHLFLLFFRIECIVWLLQSLSYCELVTDAGIHHLASSTCGADSLSVLELDNCPLISDAALVYLATCPRLQRLELYDCQLITRSAILRIQVFQ